MSGPSEDTTQTPPGEGGPATAPVPASEETHRDPPAPDSTVREDEYRRSHAAPRASREGPPERTLFGDRYRTGRELGRGGMGRVFLGHDERLDRAVAIKVLRADVSDPSDAAHLLREARLVASLHHPNVLQVHDVGIDDGVPYLVQELLEGEMLKSLLAQGPLPSERALELSLQTARGMAAAHQQGVIHCDLKPSNLFVTKEGTLKILDFGIARLQGTPAPRLTSMEDSQRSQKGFSGTPAYSSPEQLRCEQFDGRSDIFSLGVVLYEALSGRRPFTGRSQLMVSYSVLTRAPAALPRQVPAHVRRLVLRCLEKEPARRFQTAGELAEALGRALSRKPHSRAMRALQGVALGAIVLAAGTSLAVTVRALLRPPPKVQQITYLPGAVWSARFAADGKTIYYGEAFDGQRPRVMRAKVGNPEVQDEVLADALPLAVSGTGELAVILRPEFSRTGFTGTLALIPAAGGEMRVLSPNVVSADFSSDGTLAFATWDGVHARLEYPAGKVLHEATGAISHLRWDPSGGRLAFVQQLAHTDTLSGVMVLDLGPKGLGRAEALLPRLSEANGLAWSADGAQLYFSGQDEGDPAEVRTLRAVDARGKVSALRLQSLVDVEVKDSSRKGLVLMTQPLRTLGLQVADESGDRSLAVQDEQLIQDLSSDGARLLYTTDPHLASRAGYLFVRSADGGPPVHFADGYGGALSPDGASALVFDWAHKRAPLVLHSFATGKSRSLSWATLGVLRARYFPDGRKVLLVGVGPDGEPRLFALSFEAETITQVTNEPVDQRQPFAASVDGQWVAAVVPGGKMLLWKAAGGPGLAVEGAEPGEVPLLFDSTGALLVGRLAGASLTLRRLDLTTGGSSPLPPIRLQAAPSQVSRLLLAKEGHVAAYLLEGWKTHLYLTEGLR